MRNEALEAQTEAEIRQAQQQAEAERAAYRLAGQALLAQEAIRTMRPIVEGALGQDLLLEIGRQINGGAFTQLNKALDQMIATFQNGFQCTADQARMCLMYAILFPENAHAQPPRLATKKEQRQANKKRRNP